MNEQPRIEKRVRTRSCRCLACFGRKVRAHDREVQEVSWRLADGREFPTRKEALAALAAADSPD